MTSKRLLDETKTLALTILADAGIELAQDLSPTQQWLRQHGVVPSAVFSESRINYIHWRLAVALVRDTPVADKLKCAIDDSQPYLQLIASFRANNSAKYEPILEFALAEEVSELFYSSSRPERFDIFNHMSAGELFFIDADSLLLEALCNYHVHWDYVQTLHVLHLVRKILHGYKVRGGNFHVIEFECNHALWVHAPKLALIREVLVHHLHQQLSEPNGFEFQSFHNWWDEGGKKDNFKAYVKRYGPEFVVVNDAEQLVPDAQHASEFSLLFNDAQAVERTKSVLLNSLEVSRHATLVFRSFIAALIAERIHVVYSSRQVHKDNGIIAFVVRAHSSKFRPLAAFTPCLTKWWERHAGYLSARPDYTAPELCDEVNKVFNLEVCINTRELVVALALRELLHAEASATEIRLAKAFLVSVLVQRDATLGQRAQVAPVPSGDDYNQFLLKMSSKCEFWLNVMAHDKAGVDSSIVDLMDERFFLVAAQLIAGQQGDLEKLLSSDRIAIAELIWKNAAPKGERKLLPLGPLPSLATGPAPRQLPAEQGTVHDCEFEALEDWLSRSNFAKLDEPPGVEALERAKKDRESLTGVEKTRAAKLASKQANRLAASIQATADSMGNIAFLDRNEAACIVDEDAEEQRQRESEKKAHKEASQALAASKKKAKPKKKVLSAEERIVRKNILDKANHELVKQEHLLLAKLRDRDEDLVDYVEHCSLPYRTLLGNRPQTAEESAEQNRAWRVFSTAAAKGRTEFEFMFDKDSKGVFTALEQVENFVTNHTKIAHEMHTAVEAAAAVLKSVSHADAIVHDAKLLVESASSPEGIQRAANELHRAANELAKVTKTNKLPEHNKTNDLVKEAGQLSKTSDKDALAVVHASLSAFSTGLMGKLSEQKESAIAAASGDVAELFLGEDEEEKKVILRGMYLRCFEKHLRFRARVAIVEQDLARWMTLKEMVASEHRVLHDDEWPTATKLFQSIHDAYRIIEQSGIRVRPQERNKLRKALQALDLPDTYLKKVDEKDREWERESMHFEALPPLAGGMSGVITDSAVRFQMLRMGHLFARPRPSETDSRVPFAPDDWQRELLDVVDQKASCVVCAPTSAGKTFISYYCMKNILRTSNTNIVVYVAPTRALINQAMADVYSRYGSKMYPNEMSGMKVYGCLGGAEFVQEPFHCQVLIALPETLESLLLSPKYQQWAKRIKYVIFDEIHSIDNGTNGDVWERLLMMVRCPFVALSATIGETQQLADWLNRVQEKLTEQGVTGQTCHVSVIPSGGGKIQRWSDIEKHAYLPTAHRPFKRLKKDKKEKKDFLDDALLPIHPMSCVSVEMLQAKFPQDLPFVPRESIELYDAMVEVSKNLRKDFFDVDLVQSISDRIRNLNPDTYFADVLSISQTKARDYEMELKNEVLRWGQFSAKNYGEFSVKLSKEDKKIFRKSVNSTLANLVSKFTNDVKIREEQVTAARQQEVDEDQSRQHHFPDTMEFVQDSMMQALSTLQRQDKMPCIVFSFEEDDCNRVVERVVRTLEEAEEAYRKTDEFKEFKRRIEANKVAVEKDMKTMAGYRGKKLEEGDDGKKSVREEGGRVTAADTTLMTEVPEVLEQFTFASKFNVLSKEEMNDITKDMENIDTDFVLRAFKRGIGVHHSGIKGKLRIHFERLFRLKFLPVIFATQTLALGVHSPCRSVILAGDHTELNTMQFRQMAGRAGRRGQDFRGHCIFMGVPFRKIQRLMTSDLNVLKGHVQLDSITNLRLQQLRDHEPDVGLSRRQKEEERVESTLAKNIAECLIQEPLFFHGRRSCDYETFQEAHQQAFLDFCHNSGLVCREEAPFVTTVGALVARPLNMYKETFLGNSAFAFAVLLHRGTFHRICNGWVDTAENDTPANRHILKLLANFFAYLFSLQAERSLPLEIHRSVLKDPELFPPEGSNIPACPHSVTLPGLRTMANKSLLADLERYNREVLLHFSRLMANLGSTLKEKEGSKHRPQLWLHLDAEKSLFPKKAGTDPIFQQLSASQINCTARSPFIAIAGVGDVFDSVEDIVHSLRSNLFIDPAHLPTIDFTDLSRHDRTQILMNGAVVDYAHKRFQIVEGEKRRAFLERYNGLRIATSYGTLFKFVTGVENLAKSIDFVGPRSHDERDDEQDSFIRSAGGNLLACCNPSCQMNDRDDLSRYNKCIIRGRAWRCLDCWRKGQETFMCEECVATDEKCMTTGSKVNHGHRLQPYLEDNFGLALGQLAAHCEDWQRELTRQDYYRHKQELALARQLNLSTVSLSNRHVTVKFD